MIKTTAERFADNHRSETRAFQKLVSMEKAVPTFDLSDRFSSQGFLHDLIDANHTQEALAYSQFKRWTYVAISAIARRMASYQYCAGEIVGGSPNPARVGDIWTKNKNEDFQRCRLTASKTRALPEWVRKKLGGTLKAPASSIEVLDNHESLDLLEHPNHVQKKAEFIFCLVANLYLTGEAWLVGGQVEGQPFPELWAIPSTWVDVIHKDNLFSDYRLRINGSLSTVPVPKGAITRLYYPDPSDLKRVTSPVIANWEAIKADESLQKAHKASFDQGIFPKIAIGVGRNIDHTGKQLATRPVLTGEQREQLMSAIHSVWMSSAGDGMPAILDGLIESIQVLQNTPVEMDYMNSSKMIKDRIFQAFGLNPIIVGEITASNKAQALVAERSFCRNVLHPLADNIGVALTDWMGPWYDTPSRLTIWLEKDEPADEDLVVNKWQHAVDHDYVTQDEFRMEMFGLEPKVEDDESTRGSMLDNPAAMTGLANMIQLVRSGKLDYEAATAQTVQFFNVDEEVAKQMLGKKPTDEEIEAATTLPIPPAGGEQEEDEEETTPPLVSDDEGEEEEGSETETESRAAVKKKAPAKRLTRRNVKEALREMQQKRIEKAIPIFDGFFRGIITDVVRELSTRNAVPVSADELMPRDLLERFINTASRPLIEGIVDGAMAEIELFDRIQRDKHREAKLTTAQQVLDILGLDDLGEWFDFEVPEWLRQAALTQIASSFDQPYWSGVIDTTRDQLQGVLDTAISEGLSIRQTASNIMSTMGRDYSRMRATRVARTEMTDALNYGHAIGIKRLNEEVPELEMGKEWLSVFAQTSRSAHMQNDGIVVPVEGSFTLNGVQCNHPGDQSLPASDRINCMCTVLSSFLTDELDIKTEKPETPDGNVTIKGGSDVQKQLTNDTMSNLHRFGDRISKFISGNRGEIEIRDTLWSKQKAYGMYGSGHKIVVDGGSTALGASELRLGQDVWAVGTDLGTVVRHETGHRYWFMEMTTKEKDQFRFDFEDEHVGGLFGDAEEAITQYASASTEELFAETFAAFTHPEYKKGMLPTALEKFMKAIL